MNQIKMMYEAIEYIEKNLTNPITVKDVADRIGYSIFHFIRLFNSIVKHSPYDYIMRRRLSEAAKELINENKKIIDIAFNFQFNSHEVFSRSFSKMFGLLPNQVKKKGLDELILKTKDSYDYLTHISSYDLSIPEIITLEKKDLVGISKVLQDSEIKKNDFINELKKKQSLIKESITPLQYYSIAAFNKKNYQNPNFYMIGTEVKSINNTPDILTAKIIKKSKYLKFKYCGDLKNKNYFLDYIYQTWLPKSECVLCGNYQLESFHDLDRAGSEHKILIPIK